METVKLKEVSFYSYETKVVLMGLGVPEKFARLFVHKDYWTLLRSMDMYDKDVLLERIEFGDSESADYFNDAYEAVHHGSVVDFDGVTGEALVQGPTGIFRTVHLALALGRASVTIGSLDAVDDLIPTVVMDDDVALDNLRAFIPNVHSVSFTSSKCSVRLREDNDDTETNNKTDNIKKDNGKEIGN